MKWGELTDALSESLKKPVSKEEVLNQVTSLERQGLLSWKPLYGDNRVYMFRCSISPSGEARLKEQEERTITKPPATFRIFYSWQSDLPNATNRGLIQSALEKVASRLTRSEEIGVDPVIDRDTENEPGSPDIAATIFRKIDESALFIADVSIINQAENSRRATPNPNVLIELGYARKSLGPRRVVIVMNTHYGAAEQLPFDLRGLRVLQYAMAPDNEDRATVRKGLVRAFEKTVAALVAEEPLDADEPPLQLTGLRVSIFRKKTDNRKALQSFFRVVVEVTNPKAEATTLSGFSLYHNDRNLGRVVSPPTGSIPLLDGSRGPVSIPAGEAVAQNARPRLESHDSKVLTIYFGSIDRASGERGPFELSFKDAAGQSYHVTEFQNIYLDSEDYADCDYT